MTRLLPRSGFTRLLASVNGDGGYGLGVALVIALLLLAEAGGDGARTWLRYDRAGIAAGEWWRLLSAHFVHLDLAHAALNAVGAALMWALFARDFAIRQWAAVLIASIVCIDAGFWFLDPRLEWYVGASGLLHGVMAAGTVAHLRRRELDGWALLGFLVVKLAWEQWHGALPWSGAVGPVIVNAHLYGAVGGALCALGLRPRALRPDGESL